ncbi:MAG: thiamine pyrophosphate-dependent enzyme [Promethearchaeota archaeon]
MVKTIFDMEIPKNEIGWCPGCGNFPILDTLKLALMELDIKPEELVVVSGIGQAAKTPQYLNAHMFNGLHGRYLSAALGIKAINPDLHVVAISGDGCTYGEGGNHFLSTIRANPNITNLVHNNGVYGLTKGQASPTSPRNMITPLQIHGHILEPFQPLPVAISLNASFVARAFAGDKEQTKEIMKKAINHKGYALVDIFQPCVTFNKLHTYKYFKKNTYYLEEDYKPYNQLEALKRALETKKLPLGIFYINPSIPTFEESIGVYETDKTPIFERFFDKERLEDLLASKTF